MQNHIPIKYWHEDEQPREKLLLRGRNSLSDAELIAILLGTGSSTTNEFGQKVSKSAIDLAKEILALGNNELYKVCSLGVEEFQSIKGIGEAKAITIVAALELGHRRRMAEILTEPLKINNSKDAYNILRIYLEDLQVEQFWILLLNRSNTVIKQLKISEGGYTGTVAEPSLILKQAILNNAKSLILCHNHPSGNLMPSMADKELTKKIKQAAQYLDICIFDHIIVTHSSYYSFADNGEL